MGAMVSRTRTYLAAAIGLLCLADGGVYSFETDKAKADCADAPFVRFPVLKELLSGTLEFHHIIQREEANLWKAHLQKQPSDAKLLLRTADALMIASQCGMVDEDLWFEAKELLKKSIGRDPNNTRAWLLLSHWYENEMVFDEARKCVDKAKKLGARSEVITSALADIDDWDGRVKSGRMSATPVRKLAKKDSRTLHERRPLESQSLSVVTMTALNSVGSKPKDSVGWCSLGTAVLRDKALPELSMELAAYQCFVRAKRLDPNDIDAREQLVDLYLKNGVPELMKEECRGILEVNPNHVLARHLLKTHP